MNLLDRLKNLPPVTKNLLIINILIYIAMALIPSIRNVLGQYCSIYYITSEQFRPWQLLTYMFIHANFWHLFFNMFALFMFGEIVERTLNSRRYLFFYLSCGLGAALLQEGIFALMINHYAGLFEHGDEICRLLSHNTVNTLYLNSLGAPFNDPAVQSIINLYHTPTVGASGAIYGLLLAFGFLYPHMRIYLMFPPIPMKARTAVIVFAVIELALGVYNSQADTVAHFAHLGGMLVGLAILLWWKRNHSLHTFF